MKDFKAIMDQYDPKAKQNKIGNLGKPALEGVGEERSESDDDWALNLNFSELTFSLFNHKSKNHREKQAV